MKKIIHIPQFKKLKVLFADGGQLDMFGGSELEPNTPPSSLDIEGLIADIDNASLEKIESALAQVQSQLRILRDYDRLDEDPASHFQAGSEPSDIVKFVKEHGGTEKIDQIRSSLMSLRTQERTLRSKKETLAIAENA